MCIVYESMGFYGGQSASYADVCPEYTDFSTSKCYKSFDEMKQNLKYCHFKSCYLLIVAM